MNFKKTFFSRIPALAAGTLLLLTFACGCESNSLVYYEPPVLITTAETEETPETSGPMDGMTVGASYGALPLAAYTRVALNGESYADAELYTACGTTEEVWMTYQSGTLDLAFLPYALDGESEPPENTQIIPIARQALVFYVCEENPVRSLTADQLRDIYTGKIAVWEELGGSKAEIVPIQRGEATAAEDYLKQLVGGELLAPQKSLETGGNAIFAYNAGEIGCAVYSTGLFQRDDKVRILEIDGVAPTQESVLNGTYPLCFDLCAVCRENSPAQDVAAWLTAPDGQSIAAAAGYLPLSTEYNGFVYAVPLYDSLGTSERYLPDTVCRYWYTLPSDSILKAENGGYTVAGLADAALTQEINAFLTDASRQLDELRRDFNTFLRARNYTGKKEVSAECINGYLSLCVRLAYTGDNEYSYRVIARTYDLYTGEALDFSDLFCRDYDFLDELNRSLFTQSAEPYDRWNSIRLLKQEFTGLPLSFAFTLSEVHFDIANPFFIEGESFSLDDVFALTVLNEPRDMAGIWTDETAVTRAFRKYVPDGLEPEALYDTVVYDGRDSVESLVYCRLKAQTLNLDTAVCDSINNAMYAYLKNTMSPDALRAAIAQQGIAAKDFYYVGQNWYPVFYGDRFVRFTHRGSIEYVTPAYEYGTFDYSPHDLFFSLKTGEPLAPADLFTENWKEAASWTAYLPDGSVGFTGFAAVREVYLPDIPEIILTLSELTVDEAASNAVAFFDVTYVEIEDSGDGTQTQSILLTNSLPRYAAARLTVPASYIDWDS